MGVSTEGLEPLNSILPQMYFADAKQERQNRVPGFIFVCLTWATGPLIQGETNRSTRFVIHRNEMH